MKIYNKKFANYHGLSYIAYKKMRKCMKLNFIKVKSIDKNCKATIHKNGQLGFTKKAIERLKLDQNRYMSVAVNEDEKSDNSLYVFINSEEKDGDYKINKAGTYFYANTKLLFETLGIDYKGDYTIMYDITESEYEGEKMYKFSRRDIQKSKKNR